MARREARAESRPLAARAASGTVGSAARAMQGRMRMRRALCMLKLLGGASRSGGAPELLQFRRLDVAEFYFHDDAAVDLEADGAFVGEVGGFPGEDVFVVEPDFEDGAAGFDAHFVPLAGLEEGFDALGFAGV